MPQSRTCAQITVGVTVYSRICSISKLTDIYLTPSILLDARINYWGQGWGARRPQTEGFCNNPEMVVVYLVHGGDSVNSETCSYFGNLLQSVARILICLFGLIVYTCVHVHTHTHTPHPLPLRETGSGQRSKSDCMIQSRQERMRKPLSPFPEDPAHCQHSMMGPVKTVP